MTRSKLLQGFTLIEIVVALALLSLIAVGLTTALKTVSDSARRLDSAFLEYEEVQSVVALLESALESASSKPVAIAEGRSPSVYFLGRGDGIEWLGVLPARYGFGGMHFLRLEVGVLKDGSRGLVLRYLPYVLRPGYPDWTRAEEYMLLKDVREMHVMYQGLDEQDWVEEWLLQPVLPGKLLFNLASPGRTRTEGLITVYAAERRPAPDGKMR